MSDEIKNMDLWADDSLVHKEEKPRRGGADPVRPHVDWNPTLVVAGHAVVTIQEILDLIRRNVPTDTHEMAKSLADEASILRFRGQELRNALLQIRVALQGWSTHNAPLAGAVKQLLQQIIDDTHFQKGQTSADAKYDVNRLSLDDRIMFDPRNEIYVGRIYDRGH